MISVVVGTYGDSEYWGRLAMRAMASAPDCEVVWVHGNTLAQARNEAARRASGDRLVFLDADDVLAEGFAAKVVEPEDVLQPLTIYRSAEASTEPYYIEPRDKFTDGNHIVVGAPVKRDLFLASGGFEEYAIAEDWALWLKLHRMGATFGRTQATYIVNINPNGRNNQPDNGEIERIRNQYL